MQNNNKEIQQIGHEKKAVLQLIPALVSGGAERGTIEIAEALVKNGYRSYVASSGGMMLPQLYQTGSKHFLLPLESKDPFTIYTNSIKISKIVKDLDIPIIHARSRAPAWSGYLAAQKAKCKFLTTFHGMYSYNNPLKHYYNSVMTKGEKVIAVSNFIAEHINQAYNISYDKIEVIHRGVDLDYFNPASVNQQRTIQMSKKLHIPTDRPIILLPGRLTRWKGQKFLLEALRLLPRSSFFCLIVGSSNGHSGYLKELGHIITKYELQNDVCITNNVIDMPALYMLADLVISASVQPEAFGRIVTEAQAMGRLLIATNIGGTCETVIDEVTGWKVEPYDVKGLAAKIAYALSLSPEERKSKMIASRDHITTNFSVGKMCQKTIDIYNSLLDLN